jgi:prepilin-type processing-associated H-X9-DG protein
MGDFYARGSAEANGFGLIRQQYGPFFALMQFYEQGNVWNAFNSSLMIYLYENATVNGVAINMLWCPSDGEVASTRYPGQPTDGWDDAPIPMTYSSYGGVIGPLHYYPRNDTAFPYLSENRGMFYHVGRPFATNISPVKIADITDGTSSTFLFGEHCYTRYAQGTGDKYGPNWWTSGLGGDTTFVTMFPPNFFKTLAAARAIPNKMPAGENFTMTANSLHPGGCNFAFADGSVRFIKDSINSWNPLNVQYNGRTALYTAVNGGLLVPGIYQALSTRNGGEVLSQDQY